MWIMKKNILSLLISTQKLYFGDDDAIHDVIIKEPVWKWRHNYRHEINRNTFAENHFPFRHTQSFSVLDKSTGPNLPAVVLPLLKNIIWFFHEQMTLFIPKQVIPKHFRKICRPKVFFFKTEILDNKDIFHIFSKLLYFIDDIIHETFVGSMWSGQIWWGYIVNCNYVLLVLFIF